MKITEAWFPSRVQQAASTRLCLAWPFLCLIWCCVCVVPNYSNYKLYQVTDYLKVINLQLTIESAYRVQGYLKYSHLTQPNSNCQQQPVLHTRAHCHCTAYLKQTSQPKPSHRVQVYRQLICTVYMVWFLGLWQKDQRLTLYYISLHMIDDKLFLYFTHQTSLHIHIPLFKYLPRNNNPVP